MAWTGKHMGYPPGHTIVSLCLSLLLVVTLSECSPLNQKGHVLHSEGVNLGSETLEEPKSMGIVTPSKDNSHQEEQYESVEERSNSAQGEEDEIYHSQDGLEDLSGEEGHVEERSNGGQDSRHHRDPKTVPGRSRSQKQSASRDLLNALREHRHQRFQQLERLQTLSEPEVPDDENADDSAMGFTPGAGPGVGPGRLSVIPPPGAVSPEQLGLSPSSMVRISGGSERGDSAAHSQNKLDVIKGSRRAFNVTKLEYLKKEWCKTERFRQVVREEGCLRRVIINRFCYGQCNSFFIPKSNKRDPNSAAFRSCAFCKPRRTFSVTVTLVCPSRRQRLRRKKVDVVKQCKCMAQRLEE